LQKAIIAVTAKEYGERKKITVHRKAKKLAKSSYLIKQHAINIKQDLLTGFFKAVTYQIDKSTLTNWESISR